MKAIRLERCPPMPPQRDVTRAPAELEARFREVYARELPLLQRLLAVLKDRETPSEEIDGASWKGAGAIIDRAGLLARVHERGLVAVLRGRKSDESRAEVVQLLEEFTLLGARAAISVGPQRAGDFLNNQLRGRWAEEVVLSLKVPNLTLVAFGPSGAAMPGDEDHRAVVSTYAAISLLEGKRPDLLGFDSASFGRLDPADRERIRTWPTRLLDAEDHRLIGKAICALEVKNSLWHYGRRRQRGEEIDEGDRPLSITLKEEEIGPIQRWRERMDVPVLFAQVLFDEMYCMSFERMREAIRRGYLYQKGDLQVGQDRKTKKPTYQFQLADFAHRLAEVVFPSESRAVVQVLADGYVVPHIRFAPAAAHNERADVLWTEAKFGQ